MNDRRDIAEHPPARRLSPWPVRLIVYAVMVLLALASIRVIDRHAMQRQAEYESRHIDLGSHDEPGHGH